MSRTIRFSAATRFAAAAAVLMTLSAAASAAGSGAQPTSVGQCVSTRLVRVGTRLNQPGSGSAVQFANGIPQVSYDQVPSVDAARPGDAVRLCLVSLPAACPPGDERGKVYRAFDRRTRRGWTLPDSAHSCGGA